MNFKPVVGYEKQYIVYEDGTVKGKDRIVGYRIKGLKKIQKGQIIKPTQKKTGYWHLSLSRDGVVKTHSVHRIVAESFLGLSSLQVAHVDGNKSNNHISNLVFATAKENEAHKKIHGTVASGKRNGRYTKPESILRGENHPMAKLTKEVVLEIRNSKEPSRKLAKKYNISKTNILDIKNKKIWQSI